MTNLKSLFSSPRRVGLLVAMVAFCVYLKTLAPSVTFIDSGELATVSCTLGIAHPTGYPLFTVLGWMFSKLPLAGEEIVRLNIMAAVFCAAGVYVFFLLMHLLLTIVSGSKHEAPVIIASTGAAFLLAFSETYWSQATSVEVYALHLLLLSLVLFCFVKANFHREIDVPAGEKRIPETGWWMVFAFALGLSFANHMTTVLLSPGLLYLYFSRQGGGRDSWRRIVRMGFPFLLGLSVYLYLPIRAANGALLNWGNPVTLERFLWHLSGKQFRVWIFSSTEAAGRQLKYFVNSLPHEFAYVGLFFALVGLVYLFRENRKLAIGTLLLFLSCVFYSINYDIHDIDSYFLLAYVCVAVWSGFALFQILARARGWGSFRLAGGLIVAASLAPVAVHYRVNDESSNFLVEDYTGNMFASVRPNALVLSYQWDFWVSAAYYFQIVKGEHPDVAVVDKELLRRSWYLLQLERRYPWLIQQSRAEVDAFSRELYKFEHDLPYDPAVIQARFVQMILSFLEKSMKSRPVYVTNEIEPEFTGSLQRVPEGLAFRLFPDSSFHESVLPDYAIRPFQRSGRLEDMMKNLYLSSLNARVAYYGRYGYALESQATARVAGRIANSLGNPTPPPN